MTDAEKLLKIIENSFDPCEKQKDADLLLSTSYLVSEFMSNVGTDEDLLSTLPPLMMAKGYKLFFEQDEKTPTLNWGLRNKI